MSERFVRLNSPDHMLHAKGAPVLITACDLLRDGRSGSLLCQLRLRNVGPREIGAVQVAVRMLDGGGKPLGGEILHRYQDLKLKRDEETGRKTAIVLTDGGTQELRVRVTQVSFQDWEVWETGEEAWEAVPRQQTLAAFYGDPELETQFQVRYGQDCKYAPLEAESLWFCTCGVANAPEEERCHSCRRPRGVFRDVNVKSLRRDSARRVEEERIAAEEEAELASRRKKRRAVLLGLLGALLLIGAAVLLLPRLQTGTQIPALLPDGRKEDYAAAQALLADGELDEAEAAFLALGDYADSAEVVAYAIPYARAQALMSSGDYEAAREAFLSLGDYEDSAGLAEDCAAALEAERLARMQEAYEQAQALLENEEYSQAREAFLALGDYKDSAEMANEAVYRKAESLLAFLEEYDADGVYASVSMDPEEESLFVLSEEKAAALGSGALSALRTACGADGSRVELQDVPEHAMQPLNRAVKSLYAELGGYKESVDRLARLDELADHSAALMQMLAAGELAAARDWLQTNGNAEERERWQAAVELYLPFCGRWGDPYGDPTVLPRTVGYSQDCNRFDSRVLLDGEKATLVITGREGDSEYTVELTADEGETLFLRVEEVYVYNVSMMASGGLAYQQVLKDGGGYSSSCEYRPVTD